MLAGLRGGELLLDEDDPANVMQLKWGDGFEVSPDNYAEALEFRESDEEILKALEDLGAQPR